MSGIDTSVPLVMKVMRLSQPRTASSSWCPVDELICSNLSGLPPEKDIPAEIIASADAPYLSEEFALQFPTQQGKVFAGETFYAHIDIVNISSSITVTNIILCVELSNPSGKYILFHNQNSPISSLQCQQTFDLSVSHTIQVTGIQILSCQLSYTPIPLGIDTHYQELSSIPASIKRTYKFPAQDPFKISHRIQFFKNRAVVECSLENKTELSLHLESAEIVCIPTLESTRLIQDETINLFHGIAHLKHRDTYHVLFNIHAINRYSDPYHLKTLPCFGQLSLRWRVPTGGPGYLSSYSITNDIEPLKLIELRILSCPTSVPIETPFMITMQCINRTNRSISPVISVSRDLMIPLYVQGKTQQILPILTSHSQQEFCIELIGIVPGLHHLKGIRLHDLEDPKMFDLPTCLASIFIL